MAYSYQLHTVGSSASTGPFSYANINGYLSTSHLKIYINGALYGGGYVLDDTAKTITLGTAAPAAATVLIQRETPKTVAGRVVDFADGSVLTAADLDNANLQNLYIAQEAADAATDSIGLASDGINWNAQAKRVTNAALAVSPGDLVTKQYVDDLQLYGTATAAPQDWAFTGNNSTTVFSLNPAPLATDAKMFIVEVGGVLQRPTTDYTVNAAAITFASAPGNGVGIRVRNFGVARTTGSVTTATIADGAVTTAKLASGAVTNDKIASGTITQDRLGFTVSAMDVNGDIKADNNLVGYGHPRLRAVTKAVTGTNYRGTGRLTTNFWTGTAAEGYVYDNKNAWSNTTGRYTITTDGWYRIDYTISFSNGNGEITDAYLEIGNYNGTQFDVRYDIGARARSTLSTTGSMSSGTLIYLQSGQTVALCAQQSANSFLLRDSDGRTVFTVCYLP